MRKIFELGFCCIFILPGFAAGRPSLETSFQEASEKATATRESQEESRQAAPPAWKPATTFYPDFSLPLRKGIILNVHVAKKGEIPALNVRNGKVVGIEIQFLRNQGSEESRTQGCVLKSHVLSDSKEKKDSVFDISIPLTPEAESAIELKGAKGIILRVTVTADFRMQDSSYLAEYWYVKEVNKADENLGGPIFSDKQRPFFAVLGQDAEEVSDPAVACTAIKSSVTAPARKNALIVITDDEKPK